jgi:hypothetical protein
MKYLKTNEGLFTGKAEKVFSKLIEDLEKRLTEGGYEFKKEPNKVFIGRMVKDIIKTVDYTINKDDIEYLLKVLLVKEGSFDKPFVHAVVDADQVVVNEFFGGRDDSANVRFEIIHMELTENSLSIYELLKKCKQQIQDKNSKKKTERSFYEDFPIEDIKDRLLDLTDEFGMACEVSKIQPGAYPAGGYEVDMELDIKFIKLESFGNHYRKADEKMDIYARVIVEVNNLSKVFNSMGLTMWFEPYHLINTGSVSFRLYKTIEE